MTWLPRRGMLAVLLAGTLAPTVARPRAARAEAADIRLPVTTLYTGLETVMRAGRATPFPKRFETLAPVIDRAFDLETILKVSVGLRWSTFDPSAQASLFDVFRRFTIATYVANFDKYEGEKFEVLPELRTLNRDQVVQSRIISATGGAIRVDYVMRESAAGWRIVDVLLDGTISRVAIQRSDFRALVAPGDASALIASLQRKVADLSGGTLAS